MDIIGADFFNVMTMMEERLGAHPIPIQIPIGSEDKFKGIVDLIHQKAYIYSDDLGTDVREVEIPDELKQEAQKFREKLIEVVADIDEEIMIKALKVKSSPGTKSKKAIRKGCVEVKITPFSAAHHIKTKVYNCFSMQL